MEESLKQLIDKEFPHAAVDMKTYSPLALAFLGDAVYSLMIRSMIVSMGNRQPDKLHRLSSRYVCAAGQAAVGEAILEEMTPEEEKIYRRGRNASPGHRAKNASMEEYLKATALETLCGYLFLQDKTERLAQLIGIGFRKVYGEEHV